MASTSTLMGPQRRMLSLIFGGAARRSRARTARHQLVWTERFHYVVVGAGIEPEDPLGLFAPSGTMMLGTAAVRLSYQ